MLSRRDLFEIIFGTATKAGRRFDLILLYAIALSVITVLIESIPNLPPKVELVLNIAEWTFTCLFAIEYGVRLYVVPHPLKYALSFWGIIDLLSFLPSVLSFIFFTSHYLVVVRLLRLLRVFRILKLTRFLVESKVLYEAIRASVYKISIFMMFVLVLVVILGSIMYIVEGGQNGFNSIPQSIYWAIITITTVGYGDIVPVTVIGKAMASFVMLVGYAIIAVPTGIVTVEFSKAAAGKSNNICPQCQHHNPNNANYCNKCGHKLIN